MAPNSWRIHHMGHGTGTSRKHDPEGTGKPEAGKRLLEALNAYIHERRGEKGAAKDYKKPDYTLWNKFCVGVMLLGLLLLATLLPEWIFKDERYKLYFDKLLTWAAAAGLLGGWLKSPDTVRKVITSRLFPFAAFTLTLVCPLFIFELARINAPVEPQDAVPISIEGKPLDKLLFHQPLRGFEVRLAAKDDDSIHRTIHVSMWDLIKSGGRLAPVWRLDYPYTINCAQMQCPTPSTVELQFQ